LVKVISRDWWCSAVKIVGRPNTSQEDADRILEAFSRSSQKPNRRTYLQLGIPQTNVWRIVHNRLHFHAYKVQTVQALKLEDKPRLFQFAKDFLSVAKAGENYFQKWIFSDETTFYV
jgi:hypothetical protein